MYLKLGVVMIVYVKKKLVNIVVLIFYFGNGLICCVSFIILCIYIIE